MSQLKVKELTPDAKTVSGCGDGVRNGHKLQEKALQKSARTPVPSCRRFNTRPPSSQNSKTNAKVKTELERAIRELAVNPKVTRRKSLTMAEITPTKTLSRKQNGLQPASAEIREVAKAPVASTTPVAPNKEEDAGRRVYQLLLLNAWRRRRTQVATLSESRKTLETEIRKFELQINVLRNLRKSECEKRSEAVVESQRLEKQMDEVARENRLLIEEKDLLEEQIKKLEQKAECLKLKIQNGRNEWVTTRNTLMDTEHQLGVEREKLKRLREEKELLIKQLAENEVEAEAHNNKTIRLEEKLLGTESNLQEALLSNAQYENEKKVLFQNLDEENKRNEELQKQVRQQQKMKETLQTKLKVLKKDLQDSKLSRTELEKENEMLKKDLAQVVVSLKQERERPWWRNAGELALVPLNALQTAAHIMLPAVPNRSTKSQMTSTTSILS